MKRRATAEDVRKVALAALATALDDGKQEARKKPGLTGVRAVATGAVLYTAGRAAFAGRRFYRDHFGADGDEHEDTDDDDEPRGASDDEEYDDDEYLEDEDEDDDDPRAERDDGRHDAADRPPVHGDGGDEDADPDLPPRPSRRRKPVKT
jgi:hypothetical protein